MKDEEFAEKLNFWISPSILADALQEIANNKTKAFESVTLYYGSLVLDESMRQPLEYLINKYLKHVLIPLELIPYLKFYIPDSCTQHNINLLKNISFSGKVTFFDKKDDQDSLFRIDAPYVEQVILEKPLIMLVELIARSYEFWKHVLTLSDTNEVHFEPFSEWGLMSYVSVTVAKSLGFRNFDDAGVNTDIFLLNNFRNSFSISGPLPRTEEELNTLHVGGILRHRNFDDTLPFYFGY